MTAATRWTALLSRASSVGAPRSVLRKASAKRWPGTATTPLGSRTPRAANTAITTTGCMARRLHLRSSIPLRKFASGMIAVLLIGQALAGQDPAAHPSDSIDAFQARLKNRAFASADILKQFQGQADEVYRLGCGDEITLDVWGH